MYSVTVAEMSEWQQSRGEWNALAAAMRVPTVFCSWEWIYGWWEQFSSGRDLLVLFIRRRGQLKGILPLYRERRVLSRDGRFGQVLGYCSATDLYPDPLDIISAEADADACIAAAMDYLRKIGNRWDVLQLQHLTDESRIYHHMTAAPTTYPTRITQESAEPYISITGSYDSYLQGLSANERSNVRRRRRKCLEQQGVAYVDLGAHEQQDVLRKLFELHEKRAAEKVMQSTFFGSRVQAFHEQLLRRLDPRFVWLRALQHNNELVAAFYGFSVGRSVAYYQLGYDPSWSALSPGAVLLQETIRESFEKGYSEYNFLQGEESFKYRWTGQNRRLHSIDIFNRSVFGRISRSAIVVKECVKSAIRSQRATATHPLECSWREVHKECLWSTS